MTNYVRIFYSAVDPQGLYAPETAPWQACWPVRNCFNQVIDKSNRAAYLFEDEVSFFSLEVHLPESLDNAN